MSEAKHEPRDHDSFQDDTLPHDVSLNLDRVKQFYVDVEKEEYKLETLMDLYDSVSIPQSVIFCNTRRKAEWLSEKMNDKEFSVSFMHADMQKGEREDVMKAFRSGSSRVLISTDMPLRGMDMPCVSIVINYDLSANRENYLHRIGRYGRYGRKSFAINFVTTEDIPLLKELREFYNTTIEELPMDFASDLE